jgi:ATP-dependent DNA helicase
MASSSSLGEHSPDPESRLPTIVPSSPPSIDDEMQLATTEEKAMYEEEKKAQIENDRAEERRRKLALKKKHQIQESKAERETKAKQLDDLLMNCAKFSDILTKKTEVLGRVGSGFDGKALGEHDLVMAKQPKCMIGGTMRDYQLEGLTWMYEICSQGMSGILADEMGLGKTIQTISLIAKLREEFDYMGPHLIVAPLSTLSNWMDEFNKWVPGIPVALYHGTPPHRREIFQKQLMKNIVGGRVNNKFPVVLTTPEIVIRDANDLAKIKWELIIIVSPSKVALECAVLISIQGRRSSFEELRLEVVPHPSNLYIRHTFPHYWYPVAKQSEGTLVTAELPASYHLRQLGTI